MTTLQKLQENFGTLIYQLGVSGGVTTSSAIDIKEQYEKDITTAYLKGLERAKEIVSEIKREAMENIAMIHSSNQSAASELAYRDALSNILTALTTEITSIKEGK